VSLVSRQFCSEGHSRSYYSRARRAVVRNHSESNEVEQSNLVCTENSLQLLDADRFAIKVLPVDLPARQAPIALITLKKRTLTPVVERFIEFVREGAKSVADQARNT
jgi:hypothetical protein